MPYESNGQLNPNSVGKVREIKGFLELHEVVSCSFLGPATEFVGPSTQ